MTVDSFKFLPGSIAAYYRNLPVQREEPVPFAPLARPLASLSCVGSAILAAA